MKVNREKIPMQMGRGDRRTCRCASATEKAVAGMLLFVMGATVMRVAVTRMVMGVFPVISIAAAVRTVPVGRRLGAQQVMQDFLQHRITPLQSVCHYRYTEYLEISFD